GGIHLRRGFRQNLRDLRPVAVRLRDASIDEPARQLLGLFAQSLLREAKRREVLVERLLVRDRAVARRLERRRDDLALFLRKLARFIRLTAATTSAAATLALAILVLVRSD